MQPVVSPLSPSMPRTGNAFGRWFGRCVLRLGRWRLVGDFPDLPKVMVIVAPHSSFWDAIWGLAAKLALGAEVHFMAKKELFIGPLGWLLRALGGIPTDRRAPGGIIGEMVQHYASHERFWLGIAPEGTRKPVERWKSGFWRIASEAGVPVLCASFHYPERRIHIGPVFELSDDMDADIARMREWFRPWQGKHRGV